MSESEPADVLEERKLDSQITQCEHPYLPEDLHNESNSVKLVYRYLWKCQNGTLSQLHTFLGISLDEARSAVMRLQELGYVDTLPVSTSERYVIDSE